MAHTDGDSALLFESSTSRIGIPNVPETSSKELVDAPTAKDSPRYNMKHKKRGKAFIFNHSKFKKDRLNERIGSETDCADLKKVLEGLKFEVEVFHDYELQKLNYAIEGIAKTDHSDADCVFIAVLTYGESGSLHAYDETYLPEVLWESFIADKCTTLTGKPKLFFIQACEAGQVYKINSLSNRTQTDGCTSEMYSIPNHADFLVAYSTVPGCLSWHDKPHCGSWFIKALTEELAADAKKVSLLSLLTCVIGKVADNLKTNTSDQMKLRQKQIPCFNSMLTRILIFDKK